MRSEFRCTSWVVTRRARIERISRGRGRNRSRRPPRLSALALTHRNYAAPLFNLFSSDSNPSAFFRHVDTCICLTVPSTFGPAKCNSSARHKHAKPRSATHPDNTPKLLPLVKIESIHFISPPQNVQNAQAPAAQAPAAHATERSHPPQLGDATALSTSTSPAHTSLPVEILIRATSQSQSIPHPSIAT